MAWGLGEKGASSSCVERGMGDNSVNSLEMGLLNMWENFSIRI